MTELAWRRFFVTVRRCLMEMALRDRFAYMFVQGILMYCTRYCNVLYCTVLNCIALYCTVMYGYSDFRWLYCVFIGLCLIVHLFPYLSIFSLIDVDI